MPHERTSPVLACHPPQFYGIWNVGEQYAPTHPHAHPRTFPQVPQPHQKDSPSGRRWRGESFWFLKTLEEPPPDCLLLLLSDSPELLLLPTILSRCVRLALMPAAGGRVTGESGQELIDHLGRYTREGLGNVNTALSLRASFSSILAKRRVEISKANDLALKEETKKYKNTTDSDDWLKDREKFYLAHTEAEYLNERERLLEILISWMGDVVRQKCGVSQLDLSSASAATSSVADKHPLPDLLQRIDALEALRANLETNAQEQLALEVAFLEAFG